MTSRNLCFKLMKEDLKRRVWTIALTILGLLFTILIPTAVKCSEYIENAELWNDATKRRMAANIVGVIGINGLAVFILIVVGVLWAVSGFHYLHNSKKVDFYHSIPVKRHVLFLANYLNGILVPAVIYLAVLAPSVALAYRAGLGTKAVGIIPWQAYALNIVYYSLLYTTTVIAMMMTGNVVIALLGTGVFCAYGPAVAALVRAYYGVWFHTFYETDAQVKKFYQIIRYSSPFSNYMYALGEFGTKAFHLGTVAGVVAVTAALAVLAYALYRIRPSETAGKAMAFEKTEMPIKVLLVIPLALAFGMFFYGLRGTVIWLVFGTVCGALLVHCVIEIIYHFDFRKLLSHKIHLAGCMAAAVLLSLAGFYDWYGYDSWLPDGGKLSSAAIVLGYRDNWVTYGKIEAPGTVSDRGEGFYWGYQNAEDYAFENMEYSDVYTIMELAKKGVQADERRRSGDSAADSNSEWERYTVLFQMSNGKKAARMYSIPVDAEMEEIRRTIHDSQEYKMGTYPILKQTAPDTAQVNFQQYNKVQPVELSHEEMAHLLNVYQTELEELTMDTREKELPIATIQFQTKEMKEACDYNLLLKEDYYGIENRCYYPVYPSFTRTLEILEKAGITPRTLDADTLSQIDIYYYAVYSGEDATDGEIMREQALWEDEAVEYTAKEDIQALVPALCYQDYYDMNSYYKIKMVNNVNVSGTMASASENPVVRKSVLAFYLDANKLSEEEMNRFGFYMTAE